MRIVKGEAHWKCGPVIWLDGESRDDSADEIGGGWIKDNMDGGLGDDRDAERTVAITTRPDGRECKICEHGKR